MVSPYDIASVGVTSDPLSGESLISKTGPYHHDLH